MPIAIEYETLHVGDGSVLRDGTLVVDAGRVSVETVAPEGAQVLTASCVVPGLVNAHAHLEQNGDADTVGYFTTTRPTQRAIAAAQHAGRALRAGVTTLRDLGGSHRISLDVRDAIEAGLVPGPTVRAAGAAICMTGGHGAFVGRQADGPDEVRKAVREQVAAGADCIKLIATGGVLTPGTVPAQAQLSLEELTAGVDEAHRHGLRAAAHAIGTEGIHNAVRAGIDSIEHGLLIDDEGIQLMLDAGTVLVPTLAALTAIAEAPASAGIPTQARDKARRLAEEASDNLRRAFEAGVPIVAGSDAGTPFNPQDGFGRELELMRSMLGMTGAQIVAAATSRGATLLGVDRGTLRPGDVADVVLLGHDVDEAGAFTDVCGVLKDGRVLRAE